MLMTLFVLALLWAIVASAMVVRNPFPFPDRGHRLFAVSDETAQRTILHMLRQFGLPPRFRFRIGPSDQTLLWDNLTVIHRLNQTTPQEIVGNGISLVVRDPEASAERAINLLTVAGFTAERIPGSTVSNLPPNNLVVISSNAFLGWALAFRRHQLRMPKPKFIQIE